MLLCIVWGNLLVSFCNCHCVLRSCMPSAPSACHPLPCSRGGRRKRGRAEGRGVRAAMTMVMVATPSLMTRTLLPHADREGDDDAGGGVVVEVALLSSSRRRAGHLSPGGYLANPSVGIPPRQITPSSVGVLFRWRPSRMVTYIKVGGLVRASEFMKIDSFVSSSPHPPVVLVAVTTHTTPTIGVTTTKPRGGRRERRSSQSAT